MQLTWTSSKATTPLIPAAVRRWSVPFIVISFVAIFLLDRSTESAPVQHLYYLPIILAAIAFSYRGGLTAAVVAVGLYHLANGALLTRPYAESDIIQITLFIALGAVTAKLVSDAQKLRSLAMTDDLTGLHNLRSFESQLTRLVSASHRVKQPLSLLVLDVDRLKDLNDQYGHLAGAEAVRAVGRIIAEHLPQNSVACRYGGDEFVVALPGRTAASAEQLAQGLCEMVHATGPWILRRRWPPGTISISVGVACRSFDESDPEVSRRSDGQEGEDLFRAADQALYRAKAAGRNQVKLYSTMSAQTGTQQATQLDSPGVRTKPHESGVSIAGHWKPSIEVDDQHAPRCAAESSKGKSTC